MTRRQIILDTETTSLHADYQFGTGVIWELAAIIRDSSESTEHVWRMEPHLASADPGAMRVNGYYERTKGMHWHTLESRTGGKAHDIAQRLDAEENYWSAPAPVAATVARLLDDATLIAANPAFDAGYLTAFLGNHGQITAPWHYRLRDIGSMAYGWLSAQGRGAEWMPEMDAGTDDFARALGVSPDRFERHSALGDCRLVAAMLDVIERGRP